MTIPIDIHTHRANPLPKECILNLGNPSQRSGFLEGWYSAGIHPWHIDGQASDKTLPPFDMPSPPDNLLAIGEAGLDKLAPAPMEKQIDIFEQQALLAEKWQKPLIIHLVRATDELLLLRRKLRPAMPWIIHGFRGKPTQAEQLLKQGFHLSFGEKYNEESLRITPTGRLFLETDESPVPIRELYERAARIRGISSEELQESVRENVRRVFFHS